MCGKGQQLQFEALGLKMLLSTALKTSVTVFHYYGPPNWQITFISFLFKLYRGGRGGGRGGYQQRNNYRGGRPDSASYDRGYEGSRTSEVRSLVEGEWMYFHILAI